MLVGGVAAAVMVGGCEAERAPVATVMVDYEHDAFATQFILFVPDEVQAHPGDTIRFEQAWTGEPHTVTFGGKVEAVLEVTRPLIAEWGDTPYEEIPQEVLETYFAAESQLPMFWPPPEDVTGEGEGPEGEAGGDAADGEADEGAPTDDDVDSVTTIAELEIPQALAQPCLLQDGELPSEPSEPCEERDLPPFDGTPAYYNSGIIPYEGPGGNVFEFTLDEDIEPGSYAFYCAVHGSFQSGVVEVVPEDEPLPGPRAVAARTREQVNELLDPYENVFAQAGRQEYRFRGEQHTWNYAGLLPDVTEPDGIINEFVPADITTTVDEPVTWRMFGPHSVSFEVPEYFPIVEFRDDGQVAMNEAVYDAAGGAPPVPEEGEFDPTEPLVVDAGTYDGDGFWSSGVLWSEKYVEFTMRFSEPGSYPYACLIHPPMVGTVTVEAGPEPDT
jgi:plastocyanin